MTKRIKKLPPGVYTFTVASVTTNPSGSRMRINFDIPNVGRIKQTLRLK